MTASFLRSCIFPAVAAVWFLTFPTLLPAQAIPAGVKVEKDVAYGKHERNKLDLYLPKGDGPFPLIIWVHGGAWEAGSKNDPPAARLLSEGFAVASINYRYSSQAPFPAQIEDCKAAVRWLRANAKKYHFDPDHFGAWGASAGGHLVALLGTSGGVKELEGDGDNKDVSSRVQAVCDFFGPTDLIQLVKGATGATPVHRLLGGSPEEKKALAEMANPITYVTKDDAPFLILHGTVDPLVPVSQSELLQKALKEKGVACELIIVKGAGHGPGVATPENNKKILEFFTKNLKK